MDFSKEKSSSSCFSSQCGLCNSCCGVAGDPTAHETYRYSYPGYMDGEPTYREETNWEKYQRMLKTARGELEEVKEMYSEETPSLIYSD